MTNKLQYAVKLNSFQLKLNVAVALSILFSLLASSAQAKNVNLVFIDNSVSSESYITSDTETQINIAIRLAAENLEKTHPNCHVRPIVMVGRNDPLNIYKQKATIEKLFRPDATILVGLKNSAEMNLAAVAFKDTKYLALTSGVPAEDLSQRNDKFFSVANPIKSYANLVGDFMARRQIAKNTMIVYPGDAFFAQVFTDELEKMFSAKLPRVSIDVNKIELPPEAIQKIASEKISAIVLPVGDIQQAMPIIKYLKQIGFEGDIIGSSNWGRAMSDMNKFNQSIVLGHSQIYFPNSWSEGESSRSIEFEHTFKHQTGGPSPVGTAIYSYDTAMIAGQFMCERADAATGAHFRQYLASNQVKSVHTVRVYNGLENSNLKSEMHMVRYDSDNEKLVSTR